MAPGWAPSSDPVPNALDLRQRPRGDADDRLAVGDDLAPGHDRPGADGGILADLHRRDEDRPGADHAPGADRRLALLLAVEVGRDRAGSDVNVRPELGIPQVGQVTGHGARTETRPADLDERADLGLVLQHGA